MATLKESVRKIASALGGQKGSTAVTNDRHYKELRDLVSQVGGKITLRNSDLEERGGEQNHHDYLYEVELDQRSELRFRGARCFDGSREVADFNYNKLSEKQKESLTADIRDRLSMYVEIGYKENDEINVEEQLNLTLHNLKKIGIITDHQLISHNAVVIDPGYVHITAESNNKVSSLRKILSEKGVYTIGRYGGWTYCSIEDCMIEAMELALKNEAR